jgi:hypothetical protein
MSDHYKINEYGEIIREDYFFRQVQGSGVQILPFERKAWKIYLLSLVTFGIYGLVLAFAMAKETNISCAEDGEHTRGFWGVIGLSIITLGIYAIVWYIHWLNREANYLKNHGKEKLFKGSSYLWLVLPQIAVNVINQSVEDPPVNLICSIVNIVLAITILTKEINQHNEVNKTYNEINNFVQKI